MIIIADSSPLITLALIDKLEILLKNDIRLGDALIEQVLKIANEK